MLGGTVVPGMVVALPSADAIVLFKHGEVVAEISFMKQVIYILVSHLPQKKDVVGHPA
jgi:hypothetical protein